MIKVSRKRIAAIILTAAMIFTQNGVVVFSEEVTSAADTTNENVENNVETAVEETTDNPSEERTSENSNAVDAYASDDATTQEGDTSNSTSSNEEAAEAQQETASEDVKNESTSDEASSQQEVDSTPAATNETDDFNSFANQFDDNSREEAITDDSMLMESKVRNSSVQTDWYKDCSYELDDENKIIRINRYYGAGDVKIYNQAVIDGKIYNTYISGLAFCSNDQITSLSFEEGCKVEGSYMHIYLYNVISLDLQGLDTSSISTLSFKDCWSLETVNFGDIDTSNVINMSQAFWGCSKLKNINWGNIDTSNVTNMSFMFTNCSKLQNIDVSQFDTSSVIRMEGMFEGCASVKDLDLSSFNTSNVTDMGSMFKGCTALETLNLSGFNTSNVINMNQMFSGCKQMKSLNLESFDTKKVKSLNRMFSGCSNLVDINLSSFRFDSENQTNFGSMFQDCSSLKSIDLSQFDMDRAVDTKNMLYHCKALDIIKAPINSKLLDFPSTYILDNDCDGKADNKKEYHKTGPDTDACRFIKVGAQISDDNSETNNHSAGFDLTKNGHCVINSYQSFSYPRKQNKAGEYVTEISLFERYSEVLGTSITQETYDLMYENEAWGGNCYGMVTTAALMYKNKIDKTRYIKPGTNLLTIGGYDELVSGSDAYLKLNRDSALTILIENYQLWQESEEFNTLFWEGYDKFEKKGLKQAFTDVIEDVKKNKEPYLVSVFWYDYNKKTQVGHALLVDSVREPENLGNGWVRVYLYDPNNPYYDNFGNNIPRGSYNKALERFIDLNTNNGQWKIDVKTKSDQMTSSAGYDNNGKLLNNSWVYFRKVDSLPTKIDRNFHFRGYKDGTGIHYACNDITIYDENDRIIFFQLGDTIREIDKDIVKQIPMSGYSDIDDSNMAQGEILLTRGRYRVSVTRGYAAFFESDDVIGIDTDNVASVENIDSTTVSIDTPYEENVKVVLVDNQGDTKFTSLSTDVKLNGSNNTFSLKGTELDANLSNKQVINIQVSSENGAGKIENVSTDSLTDFDVENARNNNSGVNNNGSDSESGSSDPSSVVSENSGAKTDKAQDAVASTEITIKQNKNKISHAKLKKKAQKVTITVENTDGQITATNKSSKKLKKYMSVSVKSGKVICKLKKGAPKGTYKVKVMVTGDSKQGDISKTFKIKVK